MLRGMLLLTFLFGALRIGGVTNGIYQAFAHVYIGWLLAAGYIGNSTNCKFCSDEQCDTGRCCSKGVLYCTCRNCKLGKIRMFAKSYFWLLLILECVCFTISRWDTIKTWLSHFSF